MVFVDSPITVAEVLSAYHHDAPTLFLSSAFITVAVVASALCLIRRKFDPLLIFLALFAYLYGQRLQLTSELHWLTLGHNPFFIRLSSAINYLVPIPAFAFFEAAGFLGRRGKVIVILFSVLFLGLVAATFLHGPSDVFEKINSLVIILAMPAVALRSHLLDRDNRDSRVIRVGLLVFVGGALWQNIVGTFLIQSLAAPVLAWLPIRIEPYCFAVLLAALGYVSARRAVMRDQELVEVRSELDLAQRIQLSILPSTFPDSQHFRVAARYVPMTMVAGDFYDFFRLGETQTGILIADVSGHGVPAALIASMVKIAATSQRPHFADPSLLLQGMNEALCGNTQEQTVTAAYLHLDAEKGDFRYAAAGHPAMLLMRGEQITEIVENGLILAITPLAEFTQITQPLKSGDRLILHTDGLLEARSNEGKLFGEEGLHSVVRQTRNLDPAAAADQIIAKVQAWSKVQEDDLTIVICDYRIGDYG